MKRLAAIGTLVLIALATACLMVERAIEKNELTRLVGRVLVVGFDGRSPRDAGVRRAVGHVERGEIAGVMFLRRNVRDAAQVKALTGALQGAVKGAPLLVSLDQEGGRVARLGPRAGFGRTPSPYLVAQNRTPAEAKALYAVMARGLREWGFNLNFGPVVDLHRPDNPIIGRLGRSFAADPDRVVPYARAFIEAHGEAGVLTAIKHFPGHGSSTRDTHLGTVDVSDSWAPEELRPFAMLAPDVPMVMTGHVINRAIGDDVPATFSDRIVSDLLRGRLGFRGVVVSDDLQMDAIAEGTSEERAAELALRAGVDLLLFGNDRRRDPSLVRRVTEHVARMARGDAAFHDRLIEAAGRVDALRAGLVPSV